MRTNIKFTQTDRDVVVKRYAEQKVAAFEKFLNGAELEGAVCNVELRTSSHHQTGDVCYAEVTLTVHGKVYRSAKEEPTLTKAIDKVKDDILRELRIDKRTDRNKLIKGAAKVKTWLRRS